MRSPFVAGFIAAAVLLAACSGSGDSSDDPANASSSTATPQVAVGDTSAGTEEVIATVNGLEITERELIRAVHSYRVVAGGEGEVVIGSAETATVMNNLIGVASIRGPAQAVGVEFSEFLTGDPNTEQQELLNVVEQIGDAIIGATDPANREQVLETHLSGLPPDEVPYCSRHIVVSSQQTADDVVVQLEAGADFELLAATISTDDSGPFGGYLGCGPPPGFIPAFATALSELDIGQVSQPVETEFGFHVIRRDALEEGALNQILSELRNEAIGPWLELAFTSAVVELDPRLGTWEGTVVARLG